MAQQPFSYFMRLIKMDNTVRASYIRNDDDAMAQVQYPVGWTFFTRKNIDGILQHLSARVKGVDFSYICPTMQWAYETRGRQIEAQQQSVQWCVQQLNTLVVSKVLAVLAGAKKSQIQAVNYWYGTDRRSYDLPHYEPSSRVQEMRSHAINIPDPIADSGNMFESA
jgi:hypothetical protein